MKKIAIIVTWFGKLPPYFPIWLKSAEMNLDIDFFCFFDQKIASKSANIHLIQTTMNQEINRISNAVNEQIIIQDPYKFCDLRPFFGIAYQEYITDYPFWGYCDIDMAFGHIRSFLSDDVLDKFDRFYEWGHLTIFRNNNRMNHLYDLPGGIYSKEEIFRKPAKTTPEEQFGLNRICVRNHISWYVKPDYADFAVCYSDFYLLHGYRNYDHQVFYWENGHVYRSYVSENQLKTNEFVYIHWQKKNPVPDADVWNEESFYITPGRILKKEHGIPEKNEILRSGLSISSDTRKKEKQRYVIKKTKDFMNASISMKKIWLRQKYYYFLETHSIVEKGNVTELSAEEQG